MGRILKQHHEVLVMIGLAQCRFDTGVGCHAGEEQVADAPRAQHLIEIGAGKTGIARFLHHQFIGAWLELVDDLVIPGAVGDELEGEFGSLAHQDLRFGLVPHRRGCSTDHQMLRIESALDEHDEHARGARRIHRLLHHCNGLGRMREVVADVVEVATGLEEAVLHVDDDECRLGECPFDRVRTRGDAKQRFVLGHGGLLIGGPGAGWRLTHGLQPRLRCRPDHAIEHPVVQRVHDGFLGRESSGNRQW